MDVERWMQGVAVFYCFLAWRLLHVRTTALSLTRRIAIALTCAWIGDAVWRYVATTLPHRHPGIEMAYAALILLLLCATDLEPRPRLPRCAIVTRWGTSFRS